MKITYEIAASVKGRMQAIIDHYRRAQEAAHEAAKKQNALAAQAEKVRDELSALEARAAQLDRSAIPALLETRAFLVQVENAQRIAEKPLPPLAWPEDPQQLLRTVCLPMQEEIVREIAVQLRPICQTDAEALAKAKLMQTPGRQRFTAFIHDHAAHAPGELARIFEDILNGEDVGRFEWNQAAA